MRPPSAIAPAAPVLRETVVGIGEFGVAAGRGTLMTAGLGSCVAVALYAPDVRVAALAHVLLPSSQMGRASERPAKFADVAVPLLVRELQRHGATGPIIAKIAGGARMFGSLLSSGVNMGERNVEAVRRALAAANVTIAAEDVGGEYGRSVSVDVATFQVCITSLDRGDRVL
ncbi:MAG TPA: chemotaxis protein CheD [Gemmatimonadaceae bacterium]